MKLGYFSEVRSPIQEADIQEVSKRLSEVLEAPVAEVSLVSTGNHPVDAVMTIGEHTFVVEMMAASSTAPVTSAISRLLAYAPLVRKAAIPLVVVPFMGEAGKRLCQEAGIGWIDLSGNAEVKAPGLRIHVEGKPNRFVQMGRPSSPFAPKSSRVARWFLLNKGSLISQRDLSNEIGLGEGFVSRIASRLRSLGLIEKTETGKLKVINSELLFDSWLEEYDFYDHRVSKSHMSARSGPILIENLSRVLKEVGIEHAVTGLSAAWLIDRFAGFRTGTIFVADLPPKDVADRVGLRFDERGANVWFAIPNDRSVFEGVSEVEGIPCVHPFQALLDLKAQPERAQEAFESLRKKVMG